MASQKPLQAGAVWYENLQLPGFEGSGTAANYWWGTYWEQGSGGFNPADLYGGTQMSWGDPGPVHTVMDIKPTGGGSPGFDTQPTLICSSRDADPSGPNCTQASLFGAEGDPLMGVGEGPNGAWNVFFKTPDPTP